jgi:LmbE family N-acetylglucosaminyl deacetylase
MKYLFVCAHPDDLEFGCANLIIHLIQQGKHVEVLCLTKGEFGIFQEEWIGRRLGELRMKEFYRSTKILGISRDKIMFGEFIDGFVKFTSDHIETVKKWINKLQPDIIFAPEPYYAYYWQKDHINCGRLMYYLACNHHGDLSHPIFALYFYNTLKPNFFWPFNDLAPGKRAFLQHQSQMWFIKWILLFYPFDKFNYHFKLIGTWKYNERYRRISLNSQYLEPNSIFRILIWFISGLKPFNPDQSRYKTSPNDPEFSQKVQKLIQKYYSY